jgi:hypothetical protein
MGDLKATCGMMPRQGDRINVRMKKSFVPLTLMIIGGLLVLGAALFVILRPGVSQNSSTPSVQGLTTADIDRVRLEEAKAAFDSGEATFVDVRSQTAFAEDHIPGAVSIPLDELQNRLDELDPSDWIILY